MLSLYNGMKCPVKLNVVAMLLCVAMLLDFAIAEP